MLVTAANRVEAKAHIYNNHHLNQRCFWGKQLLKLVFYEFWEQQSTKKLQPKTITLKQTITPIKLVRDYQQCFDAVYKAKTEKKKNWHQKKWKRWKISANLEDTPATDANTTGEKKKAGQN